MQRVVLLQAWRDFEQKNEKPADVSKVQAMMPIVSRKRRTVDKPTRYALPQAYVLLSFKLS